MEKGGDFSKPAEECDSVAETKNTVNNSNFEPEMKEEKFAPMLIATTISQQTNGKAVLSASNYGYTIPTPNLPQSIAQSFPQTQSIAQSFPQTQSDWFYFLDNNGTYIIYSN